MEVDGEPLGSEKGSGNLIYPLFLASILLISCEEQGPSPLPPSEPDSLVGQVINETPADNICGADAVEDISVDKEPHGGDLRSGQSTCLFSSLHLISLEASKGPRASSQLPPSILDSPTAPTATLRKPGKAYPNLASALNAAYRSELSEESSEEVDGDHDISGSNGKPLRGVHASDSGTDRPMAVDSGSRVPEKSSRLVRSSSSSEAGWPPSKSRIVARNISVRSASRKVHASDSGTDRPMAVDSGSEQSSRLVRSSSSSEAGWPPLKSRTVTRNIKAQSASRKALQPPDKVKSSSRLRERNKLADTRPRLLLKPPQRTPILKRKREDTEKNHLHVIDLTGDLEDEVWLRMI